MGACGGKSKNTNTQPYKLATLEATVNNQTNINAQQQQQQNKAQTLSNEPQGQNQQKKEVVQPVIQQGNNDQQFNQDNKNQNEIEEEYQGDEVMQTIMRQFDELNNLFTEMQREFDQISQYLLTNDEQVLV